MSVRSLHFRVHGTPAPQGSKRHVGGGRMVESSAKVKPWREAVKHACLEAVDLTSGPVFARLQPVDVVALFLLARPTHHYRTGRNAHLLRDNAPVWHPVKPDLDKLLRSTLDALSDAGLWVDDAQVVYARAEKAYANTDEPVGALITVSDADDLEQDTP